MLVPTIVMAVLALVLLGVAYAKGGGEHIEGLKSAVRLFIEVTPLLVFAFIIAGLVPVLLPHELVQKWIGAESGIRGILIGTLAGGLSPGGPYVCLPLALGLVRAGAGVGVTVAYLTGWSLIAASRLPMEVGILGWKLTLIRLACTIIFAPLAGIIANALFSGVRLDTGG